MLTGGKPFRLDAKLSTSHMDAVLANIDKLLSITAKEWIADVDALSALAAEWSPKGWQVVLDKILDKDHAEFMRGVMRCEFKQLCNAVALLKEWRECFKKLSADGCGPVAPADKAKQ